MGYIRKTNTNKGRGQKRDQCPRCGKRGLGKMFAYTMPAGDVSISQQCRYCREWTAVT